VGRWHAASPPRAPLAGPRPPGRASPRRVASLPAAADVSPEEFQRDYVATGTPVVIRGLCGGWPAAAKWGTPADLARHYGAVPLRLTELAAVHGLGKPLPVRVPLAAFLRYGEAARADYPWYAFGDDFEAERAPLLGDYRVPEYFRDDVYALGPDARACFPRFRYLVVGGPRSGSNLHVDPRGTAAWNTSLCGRKRWALFPPGGGRGYLGAIGAPPGDAGMGKTAAPPAAWWAGPHARLAAGGGAGEGARLGMAECVQRPGDTIYVPAGWWHAVLNLDTAVAVTQNLLPPATLGAVWGPLGREHPGSLRVLRRAVREHVARCRAGDGGARAWAGVDLDAALAAVAPVAEGEDALEGSGGAVQVVDAVDDGGEAGAGRTPLVLASGHVVYV